MDSIVVKNNDRYEISKNQLQQQLNQVLKTDLTEENSIFRAKFEVLEKALKDLNDEYCELKEENIVNKNRIQQQLEELDKYQKDICALTSELNFSKETSHMKEVEYQSNAITSRTYIQEVTKLQSKVTELELKENKLETVLDINHQEFKNYINKFLNLEEENKNFLQAKIDLKNNCDTYRIENDNLKTKLTKLELERKEYEDHLNRLSREYTDHKEKIDRAQKYCSNNTSPSSLHLENKIISLEEEIQNYEHLLRENKQRFERERNVKIEDIKKFIEDNQALRGESHQLKEELNKTSKSLTLKEEEIMILRGYIDKKSNLSQTICEENRNFKLKCDELDLIKEQLDKFKNQSQTLIVNDFVDNKSGSIKNNNRSFTSYDSDLHGTLITLKEMQKVKVDLFFENQKLKKKIEALDCQLQEVTDCLTQKEERLGDTLQQNENMEKHILQLSKDLEELSNEHRNLMNENIEAEKNDAQLRKDAHHLYTGICIQIQSLFKNVDNILKTSENQLLVSKKLRDAVQSPENLDTADYELRKISSVINQVMIILTDEFENLLRKCVDLKQDITISNHRIYTLEKKCMNLNADEANTKYIENELRKELDQIKDEKLLIQMDRTTSYNRESKIEKENNEMKKELKDLKVEFYQYKEKVNIVFDTN